MQVMGYVKEGNDATVKLTWALTVGEIENGKAMMSQRTLKLILYTISNIWEPKWMLCSNSEQKENSEDHLTQDETNLEIKEPL